MVYSQKKYDQAYLGIMLECIVFYKEKYISLGDLRDYLEALVEVTKTISSDLVDELIYQVNKLEIIYADMLYASRTMLLDYELKMVNETISNIILLIKKAHNSVAIEKNNSILNSSSQEYFNRMYISIMEIYIKFYQKNHTNLDNLRNKLEVLVYAIKEISSEVNISLESKKICDAIVKEIDKLGKKSLINCSDNDINGVFNQKNIIHEVLDNILKIIVIYKENFKKS